MELALRRGVIVIWVFGSNTAIEPGMGVYPSREILLVFGATEVKLGASKDVLEEAKLSKNMRLA